MENLHRDLVGPAVVNLEARVLDFDVFFNVLARELDLLVDALAVDTHSHPECNSDRKTCKEQEEDIGLRTTVPDDWNPFFKKVGDAEDESGEDEVGERTIALCKALNRGIFYGRTIGDLDGRG